MARSAEFKVNLPPGIPFAEKEASALLVDLSAAARERSLTAIEDAHQREH